jgi:excisionase family DNA binding protein
VTSEGKITTTEAASILGINKATVTRWVHSGRIKPEFTLRNGQMIFEHQYILDVAVDLAIELDPNTRKKNDK